MITAIFVQGHVFGILLAIAERLQAYLSFKRVDKHFGEVQEVRQERCVQYTYIDHNIEEVNELRLICVLSDLLAHFLLNCLEHELTRNCGFELSRAHA